jgi:hypothetical protein
VLVGFGLVLGGHVEQALLDLGFVGDLGEPPTLGGHLTKIISVISHRPYPVARIQRQARRRRDGSSAGWPGCCAPCCALVLGCGASSEVAGRIRDFLVDGAKTVGGA